MTTRKRSRAASLTAIGALAMTSACSSGPDEEELSRAQFGDATEVSMFRSVSECVASGEFDQARCQEAEKTAWNQDSTQAPRFEYLTDCEDQFGFNQCRSTGSYVVPAMAGFMIGSFLGSGSSRYRYAGLYRDTRDDTYYTGSGGWLHKKKSKKGKYLIGARAFDPYTPKVQTRSDIASRGGFGGRVSLARGGGGSSGGWGG
jgi:uncharacterized protein YgiB involved in biofilm formation